MPTITHFLKDKIMKKNLISARAELNRLPSRITLERLKEKMAAIRAKWNVETNLEFEHQRVNRDGLSGTIYHARSSLSITLIRTLSQ